MPRNPAQRRDQLVRALVTKDERAEVAAFAAQFGMSMSTAGRYLILRGLRATDKPEDTDE
jgi:hypothetical protein